MSKGYWIATLSLLAVASLVCGQAPTAEPYQELPQVGPAAAPMYPPLMPATIDSNPGWYVTVGGEYLLYFIQNERTTPIVGIGNANAGFPGTNFSIRDKGNRPLPGGRFSVGLYEADYDPLLDPSVRLPYRGIEFNGFFLGERTIDFVAASQPIVVRPFFDLNDSVDNAVVVSFPGLARGTLTGSGHFNLWGLEANVRQNIFQNPPNQTWRVDLMGGFRYLNFDTDLRILQQTDYEPNLAGFPAFAALGLSGNNLLSTDFFATQNRFYGGQVGLGIKFLVGAATVNSDLKLALGSTNQKLTIDGDQFRTTPGGTIISSKGGLLALPTNIGKYSRHRFTQVPEANLNIAIPFTRNFTAFGGYNLMYWSRVLRSADQIDRVIDITQIPNFPTGGATPTDLARPAVPYRERGLFIHGMNLGVQFIF